MKKTLALIYALVAGTAMAAGTGITINEGDWVTEGTWSKYSLPSGDEKFDFSKSWIMDLTLSINASQSGNQWGTHFLISTADLEAGKNQMLFWVGSSGATHIRYNSGYDSIQTEGSNVKLSEVGTYSFHVVYDATAKVVDTTIYSVNSQTQELTKLLTQKNNGVDMSCLNNSSAFYSTVGIGNATTSNGWTLPQVSIVAVPEPATATLSLLALAGLAARRRRH
ncbi:MAG: PEP-CTERM sorting domain-containing protein [Akkermansia sp.]